MKKWNAGLFNVIFFAIGSICGIIGVNYFKTDPAATTKCGILIDFKADPAVTTECRKIKSVSDGVIDFKADPAVTTECRKSLEEKMIFWMVNDIYPEPQVKSKLIRIPLSLFPEDYKKRYLNDGKKVADGEKVTVDAVDLDDDNQPEYLLFTGSGNRNISYDVFKMDNGKLKLCGGIGGVEVVIIKHNGKTGVFSKWGLGYACASYSYDQLINGEMKSVISFLVDGSAKTIPGKNDKITIELETSNNFMKKQYR